MAIKHKELQIPLTGSSVVLKGDLYVPSKTQGLVLLVHGYGSSRHSTRNRHVAGTLQGAGLATLLFDFMAPEEEVAPSRMFDVELLGARLVDVTRWVRRAVQLEGPLGYFGATTGAAAALIAASKLQNEVSAVVSRGGRPELAGEAVLGKVEAPTLFIVGEEDRETLENTLRAREWLPRRSELEIIPGGSHFFKEPGALEAVAHLATDWFLGCFQHRSEVVIKKLA